MLRSFQKMAFFRQWLLRPDCPPLMQECQKLLDAAYDFSRGEDDDQSAQGEDVMDVDYEEIEVARVCGGGDHYYAKTGLPGEGNAYIGFYPEGASSEEWVPARIEKILKRGSRYELVIRRSVCLDRSKTDPFKEFWRYGLEAKMVASTWEEPERIEKEWISGHTVRWELTEGFAVVIRLQEVRDTYC